MSIGARHRWLGWTALALAVWSVPALLGATQQWVQLRERPFRIAVNVSARQLYQSDLVATVRDALEVSGLPPTNLELEVT